MFLVLKVVVLIEFGLVFAESVPAPVIELKTESRNLKSVSVKNLFEIVADDLLVLNNNLQSVSMR